MDLSNPFNLVLLIVVLSFWAVVMLLSRVNHRRVSINILILPFFFLILGFWINRVRMPWGTYAVCLIHVMMLPALLRVAKTRK